MKALRESAAAADGGGAEGPAQGRRRRHPKAEREEGRADREAAAEGGLTMALDAYRKKRNFETTSEPSGQQAAVGQGNSFVIQKHAARRLHYDLRLEMDGVLKSWAVTRGPSLVPGEKRLAVHVEDHPLDYGDFEGTIPKKEYGGGAVIVWDRGQWSPIGDARKRATPRGIWTSSSTARSCAAAGTSSGWPGSPAKRRKTGC